MLLISFFCILDGMEDSWDMTSLKEDEFDEFCVYIVHDRACERICPNRAQATLPRNLTLKQSKAHINNVSIDLTFYM